jgi:TonB family protein
MPSRVILLGNALLGLLLATGSAQAREGYGPGVRRWLSDLVMRIDAADRAMLRPGASRPAGTVVVRVMIAADGSLQGAEVEGSSGSPDLDQRALSAVRNVGLLPAPPRALVVASGVADLSIPVELGR